MPFLTELIVKPVHDDEWEMVEPLLYVHGDKRIQVPSGFRMDLASIPRVLTWLFPVHGRYTRAAVVHDWLYANKGIVPAGIFLRADADKIFLDAMKELGVGWFTRQAMYRAVRLGGWINWSE